MSRIPGAAERAVSVYPSRVDGWLAGVIILSFAISVWAIVDLLRSGSPGDLAAAAFTAAILIGVGLILVPLRYILTEDALVVQSGVLKRRIPFDQILRIYPSRSLISSPALSLDRLGIEYRPGPRSRSTIHISPVRREEFVSQLAAAAGLALFDGARAGREAQHQG